ncbi:MAG: DUF5680 domain-containing protein [bacterium]
MLLILEEKTNKPIQQGGHTMTQRRFTKKFEDEIWQFLKHARANTYASGTPTKPDLVNIGFEMYEFKCGVWLYRDRFAGSRLAGGQEVVWYRGRPVWYMNYGGGMGDNYLSDRKKTKPTFKFLKQVILQESEKFQPRGPAEIKIGDWRYECWQYMTEYMADANIVKNADEDEWNIREFSGYEVIFGPESCAFARFIHRFHGGIIMR